MPPDRADVLNRRGLPTRVCHPFGPRTTAAVASSGGRAMVAGGEPDRATGGFLLAAGAALVATGVAAWPGARRVRRARPTGEIEACTGDRSSRSRHVQPTTPVAFPFSWTTPIHSLELTATTVRSSEPPHVRFD